MILDELTRRYPQEKFSPVNFVFIYEGLGDLDKAFTEAEAGKIRQMLIDAEQMAQTARQKQQDAADVERSVEKATNPAGARGENVHCTPSLSAL